MVPLNTLIQDFRGKGSFQQEEEEEEEKEEDYFHQQIGL